MKYTLNITPTARRQFKKISDEAQKAIRKKLDLLCANPHNPALDIKNLQGRDGYRLRIGDYRVIYDVDNGELIINLIEVGHRREIY